MSSISLWKAWLISTRPKTLIAGVGPILIALALLISQNNYSLNDLDWIRLFLVWFACLLLQVACNFTNDYYDFKRGTDDVNRLGPKRMLQQGVLTLSQMKRALWWSYGIFFLLTLYFSITLTGWVLLMGWVSMMIAFFYTGGKYPLAYYGWGDIMAFLFFGPLLVVIINFTTGYGIVPFYWLDALILGISPGFFSLTLLNVNNLRDFDQDLVKKKFTLITFLGKSVGRNLLLIYFFLALFLPVSFVWVYQETRFFYLWFFLLPYALFVRGIYNYKGEKMNRLLGLVSVIYLIHSLMVAGIWVTQQ